MEGEIGTFSKDLLQFVTFVLSTLFTNGFMQSAEGGEMNTTLKEIANGASSDSQGLFAKSWQPWRESVGPSELWVSVWERKKNKWIVIPVPRHAWRPYVAVEAENV